MSDAATPRGLLTVEYHWREAGGCWLQGWFHAYDQTVVRARFLQDDGEPVEVVERLPRADLLPHYPMLPDGAARAGFRATLPLHGGARLRLVLDTPGGAALAEALLPASGPGEAERAEIKAALDRSDAAFERFRAEVNDRALEVMEIGARVVGVTSTSRREQFAGAARYVAFDVHAAPGIDLAGDAHELSRLTGPAAFDAMFSFAVMEHLAMPWLAVAEMNRALRPGGLVYHRTHQSFPVHEKPNDFWRYTDEGMRVLFGPVHGFEIIETAMAFPVTMYPRLKEFSEFNVMPLFPGFADVFVLARKVAEVPEATAGLAEVSRRYPAPL